MPEKKMRKSDALKFFYSLAFIFYSSTMATKSDMGYYDSSTESLYGNDDAFLEAEDLHSCNGSVSSREEKSLLVTGCSEESTGERSNSKIKNLMLNIM